MTHLLNNLYQSIEQRLSYSKTSTSFKDLIELCFIDLNGDLNCFKYLTKTVKLFFQSTFTVEHYTTRSKLIDLDNYSITEHITEKNFIPAFGIFLNCCI